MSEELKEVLAQEIKKYLLIGAGIILGCMLIGVSIITAIAGEDFSDSSSGNFGGSNVQLEGMNLYNSDGSVNLEAIQALEDKITTEYLGLTSTGAVTHKDYSKVADWLQKGLIFQCPWWAVGRANWFLEQIGSDKRVEMADGGSVITNSHNKQNFTIGTEPRPNSLICWGGGEYGHIGYVEAVDKDGTIYFSETGNGTHWYGISSLPKGSYDYGSGLSFQGFIYLTDEEYVLNNISTGGGASTGATLSAEDMKNVNSMIAYAKSLDGCSQSGVINSVGYNESSDYGGAWCGWFCWNIYYKFGFVEEGSWNDSYSNTLPTTGEDVGLNYAAGWMAMPQDAYVGYMRAGNLYPNEAAMKAYIPQPGDLVMFGGDWRFSRSYRNCYISW